MTTIAELVAGYPVLRAVMKRFQARFLPCGLAILTAPLELGGWRIHGDFVVDRAAVRRQAKSGQIKQDFLAHNPTADQVIYFSGEVSGAYPAIGRHINELAAKLHGTAHYGVDPAGRRIGNHHTRGSTTPTCRLSRRRGCGSAPPWPVWRRTRVSARRSPAGQGDA